MLMSEQRKICRVAGFALPLAGSMQGQVMQDLWCKMWHGSRFYPSTLLSPANSRSTNRSTFINYPVTSAAYPRH
jgi:hypothetical protein